jgi:hypothetical protein
MTSGAKDIALAAFTAASRREIAGMVEDFEGVVPELGNARNIPVIVRVVGNEYAMLDGFTRAAVALASGEATVMGVVATDEEYADYRGQGEDGESEWQARVLARAAK